MKEHVSRQPIDDLWSPLGGRENFTAALLRHLTGEDTLAAYEAREAAEEWYARGVRRQRRSRAALCVLASWGYGPRRRCGALARTTGEPCRRWALVGATRCRLHGGAIPQVVAATRERIVQANATVALAQIRRDRS